MSFAGKIKDERSNDQLQSVATPNLTAAQREETLATYRGILAKQGIGALKGIQESHHLFYVEKFIDSVEADKFALLNRVIQEHDHPAGRVA